MNIEEITIDMIRSTSNHAPIANYFKFIGNEVMQQIANIFTKYYNNLSNSDQVAITLRGYIICNTFDEFRKLIPITNRTKIKQYSAASQQHTIQQHYMINNSHFDIKYKNIVFKKYTLMFVDEISLRTYNEPIHYVKQYIKEYNEH